MSGSWRSAPALPGCLCHTRVHVFRRWGRGSSPSGEVLGGLDPSSRSPPLPVETARVGTEKDGDAVLQPRGRTDVPRGGTRPSGEATSATVRTSSRARPPLDGSPSPPVDYPAPLGTADSRHGVLRGRCAHPESSPARGERAPSGVTYRSPLQVPLVMDLAGVVHCLPTSGVAVCTRFTPLFDITLVGQPKVGDA